MTRLTIWMTMLFAYPGVTCGAPIILGGTGGGTPQFSLVTVNIDPPTLTTRGDSRFFTGLDFTPDGAILYGLSSSLRIVNPLTGGTTTVGPLTENGGPSILMAGMTISPNGLMYAISNGSPRKLYAVDKSNGNVTLKGTFPDGKFVRGIEFAPDGTLYGGFANLYKINPNDASIIQDLGSFGPQGTYMEDLDWASDGILRGVYSTAEQSESPLSYLYAIDPNAGPGHLVTLLSSYSGVELRSIASVPVPEPGSGLLAITGLGGVATFSRHCRRQRQR